MNSIQPFSVIAIVLLLVAGTATAHDPVFSPGPLLLSQLVNGDPAGISTSANGGF